LVAGNRNQLNLLKNKIRPDEVADAAELVHQLKLMVWERNQLGLLLCAAA
jgi:hypothetical protein